MSTVVLISAVFHSSPVHQSTHTAA